MASSASSASVSAGVSQTTGSEGSKTPSLVGDSNLGWDKKTVGAKDVKTAQVRELKNHNVSFEGTTLTKVYRDTGKKVKVPYGDKVVGETVNPNVVLFVEQKLMTLFGQLPLYLMMQYLFDFNRVYVDRTFQNMCVSEEDSAVCPCKGCAGHNGQCLEGICRGNYYLEQCSRCDVYKNPQLYRCKAPNCYQTRSRLSWSRNFCGYVHREYCSYHRSLAKFNNPANKEFRNGK